MRVRVVCDIEGLRSLRDKWQPLLDQCQPNHIFMTWEWLYTWWKHLARDLELFVLVVEEKEEVIGIVPLALSVSKLDYGGKVRSLQFMGMSAEQSWNDWMDVIAIEKEKVLTAALTYLREHQHLWDFLDLQDLPEDSDTVTVLSNIGAQVGFSVKKRHLHTCPYLPVSSDWKIYYETIPSKKVRSDVERQIGRLVNHGDMKVQRKKGADLPSNLDVLFDLKERRQGVLRQAPLFSENVREFYRGLVRVFPSEWLDCSVMTLGKSVIAAHFGFRYNSRFYYYTPTFDPHYSAFSPGKALLKSILENCFSDKDIKEFDFLRGKEPYKYQWATAERASCALLVENAYMSGWMGSIFRRSPLPIRSLLTRVANGPKVKPGTKAASWLTLLF